MKIGPSCHPKPIGPVNQMIRVHAKSLAKAQRHRDCVDVKRSSQPCDEGQCRIIINALRREIDRLLRGIDRFALLHHPRFADGLATRPTTETASIDGESSNGNQSSTVASSARKSYAVASLGPSLAPAGPAASSDATESHLNTKALSPGEKLIDLLA